MLPSISNKFVQRLHFGYPQRIQSALVDPRDAAVQLKRAVGCQQPIKCGSARSLRLAATGANLIRQQVACNRFRDWLHESVQQSVHAWFLKGISSAIVRVHIDDVHRWSNIWVFCHPMVPILLKHCIWLFSNSRSKMTSFFRFLLIFYFVSTYTITKTSLSCARTNCPSIDVQHVSITFGVRKKNRPPLKINIIDRSIGVLIFCVRN